MSWTNRAIALTAIAAGAYAGISAMMARGLTRSNKIAPEDSPSSVGLAYENVTFPSRDTKAELHGWLIPPPDVSGMREAAARRWIVMLHGHNSNRADPTLGMLSLARDLHGRGFGLLIFDMRGSGESSGAHRSAGFYERFDLLGALDYLVERGVDRERAGVLGFSLGGAVALMVCADAASAGAVAADSAFADLWLMINRSQRGRSRALALMNPGMSMAARLLYGINIGDVSPARSLAVSDTPVFLIHGEDDQRVPPDQARLMARAAGSEFADMEKGRGKLWIVPGAGHVQAYRKSPREYVDRVTEFFEACLLE